jgi:hypothetical protein
VAALMWYGFEKPILRLKRFFVAKSAAESPRPNDLPAPQLIPAD